MSFLKKLSGKFSRDSWPHVGPEPVKYFQVKIPLLSQYLCSDDSCPCLGKEWLVPGKTGFVYISDAVVQMRADSLTYKQFIRRANKSPEARGITVFFSSGVAQPLFMCEQAAKQRGLDLAVAAKDAEYMFKYGWCPLRPTPRQK
jgi:hypothetical protein